MEMEAALAVEYLLPGDALVLNNARNHTGKKGTVLADWFRENTDYVCCSCRPERPIRIQLSLCGYVLSRDRVP